MTFSRDTFVEASDTTLASHTADDGGTWTKHPSFATAAQVIGAEDKVQGGSTTATSLYTHSGSPLSADYYVQSDVSWSSSLDALPGVAARVNVAANTAYRIDIDLSGAFRLIKVVAGVATVLATWGAATAGVTYRVRISVVGTAIKGYVDGVERLSVTDASITAAGKAGIAVRQNGRVDNFLAVDLPEGNPWYHARHQGL